MFVRAKLRCILVNFSLSYDIKTKKIKSVAEIVVLKTITALLIKILLQNI